MKAIAKSTNDFEDLRTLKVPCIYVDKTAYFHRIINDPESRLFFIARPRRFGKSLMITTFKYIFEGKRELFEGLDIAKTDYDWTVSPVIHLNLGFASAATCADFKLQLPSVMEAALRESGYAYDKGETPAVNFNNAIRWHYDQGRPCVVLIDEYDDPVAKALASLDEAEKVRNELALIYGKIKDNTKRLRFLMITGVSKFTKMSVFSALSNLIDISNDPAYAEMLGYTEEDLDRYFGEHMAAQAKVMGLTDEAYRAELKRWYNGYRFSPENPVTVYNPVSVGLTFAGQRAAFGGTWTQTGRPSMLMNFIRREGLLAIDYENQRRVRESMFDVSDLHHLRAIAMLYQTGYLTIRDYDPKTGNYTLVVPDEEVRRDLAELVASQAAMKDVEWVGRIGSALFEADFELFFRGLKSLFAALPYGSTEETVHEMSCERALYVLLQANGIQVTPESVMNGGRSDIVGLHACGIYVFELKKDGSAEEAIAQIKAKGYAEPYLADGRPVYVIGLSFDANARQLVGAKAERVA